MSHFSKIIVIAVLAACTSCGGLGTGLADNTPPAPTGGTSSSNGSGGSSDGASSASADNSTADNSNTTANTSTKDTTPWGAPALLDNAQNGVNKSVVSGVVNNDGAAAVFWEQGFNPTNIYMNYFKNGSWQGVMPVFEGTSGAMDFTDIGCFDAGIDGSGNMFFAWVETVVVNGAAHYESRVKKFDGKSFGAPVLLSSGKGNPECIKIAVSEKSQVVVSWGQNDGNDSKNNPIRALYAAVYENGLWTATTQLSADSSESSDLIPYIAIKANGDATIVWQQNSAIVTSNYVAGAWQNQPTTVIADVNAILRVTDFSSDDNGNTLIGYARNQDFGVIRNFGTGTIISQNTVPSVYSGVNALVAPNDKESVAYTADVNLNGKLELYTSTYNSTSGSWEQPVLHRELPDAFPPDYFPLLFLFYRNNDQKTVVGWTSVTQELTGMEDIMLGADKAFIPFTQTGSSGGPRLVVSPDGNHIMTIWTAMSDYYHWHSFVSFFQGNF